MRKPILFLVSGLLALVNADITVSISDVEPLPLDTTAAVTSSDDLFRRSCPEEFSEGLPYTPKILTSSYSNFETSENSNDDFVDRQVYASSGSFVRGAIEAWAKHQHLVLRPDEVWFEILAQLNFYMSKNAEKVRHLFVSHQEKQEILVSAFSWSEVVQSFGTEIQSRVKTSWLLDWATPNFSTSTANDHLTATVLFMGLMQQYFDYEAMLVCGLPKITLLGEREDWVKLLQKLHRLSELGTEPTEYAKNLQPILTRFVRTWDEPESEEIKRFWRQIVRADKKFSCGTGAFEYDVSGWITGFLHWRKEGDLRVVKDVFDWDEDDEDEDEESQEDITETFRSDRTITLDNITYTPESLDSIPISYAKVPLKLKDHPHPGAETQAYLLAGNIGIKRVEKLGEVTAQPMSAWCLYAPVQWNYTTGPWFGDGGEVHEVAEWIEKC